MGKPGNPYRDPKTGQYTNTAGDIESYEALSEKDIQIRRNEESVAERNGKKPHAPHYYLGAEESYSKVKDLIDSDKAIIPEDFNFDDVKNTMKLTSTLYQKATGENMPPACYNAAGTLSAIFDSKNVEYGAFLGFATSSKAKLLEDYEDEDRLYGHAWIRRGNKVYDTINNKPTTAKAYRETREFRFRK